MAEYKLALGALLTVALNLPEKKSNKTKEVKTKPDLTQKKAFQKSTEPREYLVMEVQTAYKMLEKRVKAKTELKTNLVFFLKEMRMAPEIKRKMPRY